MRKFKGTPGKWHAELGDWPNAHDIIVDREDYAWVASVHQQFHNVATIEQAEANAKLIASAPELLEALQEMVYLFNRGLHPETIGSKACNKSIEAINKALS